MRISNEEKLKKVYELNDKGYTNRKIAGIIGVHHKTIGNWLRKVGKKSNWSNQPLPLEMIGTDHARCSKCHEIRELSEFLHGRRGQKYEYRFSYCLICRRKQVYENLNNNSERYLKDRFNRLKRNSQSRGIPFDLTFEQYFNQYKAQNGKCFYSNEELPVKVKHGKLTQSLSIDKIIPHLGYIYGNIVFCSFKCNTIKSNLSLDEIKQWMPPWYKKIKVHLKNHGLLECN